MIHKVNIRNKTNATFTRSLRSKLGMSEILLQNVDVLLVRRDVVGIVVSVVAPRVRDVFNVVDIIEVVVGNGANHPTHIAFVLICLIGIDRCTLISNPEQVCEVIRRL